MSVRTDDRSGATPAPDPAGVDTEAQAERAERRNRYEQALARVEELQSRLREADPTTREPAPRAHLRPDPASDTDASDASNVADARYERTGVAAMPPPPPPGAIEVASTSAPHATRAPTARRWQWAGVAGATLVVAVVAVGALRPAPRPSVARDATVSEGRAPAEQVASPPPAGAAEERASEETPVPARQPGGGATGETPDSARRPEEGAAEWTLVRHVNRAADYSFRYPDSWTVDESGEVTTVSSGNGHYVVSFALGPRGPLQDTYASFVGLLERSYRDVAVTSRRSVSIANGPALLVGGQAVNSSGTRIAFRAVLAAMEAEHPTIGAIAATDSAAPFDERLTDVLTSVEAG
jgi:hypothetical protein